MARPKKPTDDKTQSLKKHGALNPHPHKVVEKMFSDSLLEFFDPRDLVQVKYEMLRAVDRQGCSVKQASEAFGFSRPAFYQAQSQFRQEGVTGLVKKRPGPKSAHKVSDEIMAFIEEKILVITDFGELDCYQAQFIVGNNITAHNILILHEIIA